MRGNQTYVATGHWVEHGADELLLASVKPNDVSINVSDIGLSSPHVTAPNKNFWDYFTSQESSWMWDFVEGKSQDMSWIMRALDNKTAIMVTDGSYNRSLAPSISGAGWVLVCTDCKKMVRGCFFEDSPKASSYRGELLGLIAIHHLAAFAVKYYKSDKATGSMHCDNKGALHQVSVRRRRVRNNVKHADLLRNLRHIKAKVNFEVSYNYVKAHQDDVYAVEDLPFVQQLNVMCDLLAKQAVQASIEGTTPRLPHHQLLLQEQAVLIINGRKQTTDTSSDLRFYLGKWEAKRFFTKPIQIQGETNVGGLGV